MPQSKPSGPELSRRRAVRSSSRIPRDSPFESLVFAFICASCIWGISGQNFAAGFVAGVAAFFLWSLGRGTSPARSDPDAVSVVSFPNAVPSAAEPPEPASITGSGFAPGDSTMPATSAPDPLWARRREVPAPLSPPKPAPYLVATVGEIREFELWVKSEILDLDARSDTSERTSFQRSMLRRIDTTLDRVLFHPPPRGRFDGWGAFDDRRAEEEGLALLSAYFEQQRAHWGSLKDLAEAEARLEVVRQASELFHRLIGLSPLDVARRGAQLNLDEDVRYPSQHDYVRSGVVLESVVEGRLPEEESEERRRQALEVEAAAREAKESAAEEQA